MISNALRETYITHLMMAKELSAILSVELKDSLNFNNVEVFPDIKKINTLAMDTDRLLTTSYFCEQGRGLFVVSEELCHYMSQKFLGMSTESSKQSSPILIEYFATIIFNKLRDLYEKHSFQMNLDRRIQKLREIQFNEAIEAYNVFRMKLCDKSSEKGALMTLLPVGLVKEEAE